MIFSICFTSKINISLKELFTPKNVILLSLKTPSSIHVLQPTRELCPLTFNTKDLAGASHNT